jgi:DNA-directed RNA polymerase subunit beta'
MGHIALSAPVVHIWYLRGTRSWLAYLLMGTAPKEELKAKQLEKVIYFAAHMVTFVDVDKSSRLDLAELRQSGLSEEMIEIAEREVKALDNKLKEIEARALEAREPTAPRSLNCGPCQRGTEKELDGVRSRFAEERELAKQAFDTFEGLHSAPDHRGRSAVPRDGLSLRRVLRRRHGRRRDPATDRPHGPRRRGEGHARDDRREGRPQAALAQRHAKFLKRLAIVQSFNRRDDTRSPT